MSNKILSPAELSKKGIRYSASQRRRLEIADKFPKRVRLGPQHYGYVEREIDAWIEARIADRDPVQSAA